jgi:hypothetical protein
MADNGLVQEQGGSRGGETPLGASHLLSDDQIRWLGERLQVTSDMDACMRLEALDRRGDDGPTFLEWLDTVESWRANPAFQETYNYCMANRREAFKVLTGSMLPKAALRVYAMLDDPKASVRLKAAELVMRAHGLLIDRAVTITKDEVADLREQLMRPVELPKLPRPSITVAARKLDDDE